jgi:hypothetical protein
MATQTAAQKKEEARAEERREIRGSNPRAWIPVDVGDTICGVIADVRIAHSEVQAQGGRSGDYPLLKLVKIEEATGYDLTALESLQVHAMPAIMANELIAQEPAPGERVRITYRGLGESKQRGRNAPALFEVECPDRDPKEVAAQVYGSLKRGRPAPAAQLGDNGSDPRELA